MLRFKQPLSSLYPSIVRPSKDVTSTRSPIEKAHRQIARAERFLALDLGNTASALVGPHPCPESYFNRKQNVPVADFLNAL